MNYVEAPNEYDGDGFSVFLAGSISDYANWQARVAKQLAGVDTIVFNPRRQEFPVGNRTEERRQIEWERRHLARANLVAFWFTPPTLCPIALLELGACCEAGKPVVVGIDPTYGLKFDVSVHLCLRRPDVKVLNNLDDLARAILTHSALVENMR
jgi:hypothetical protein